MEIFGPVVVLMTFRTPVEVVQLANNTRYGLAASVWTENINLALDVAPQLKAGTVWINCTNVFDAASGFGGRAGSGGEGGRREYVRWVEGRTGAKAQRNPAPLIDLGDGVLCCEFHGKMNAIGDDILAHAARRPGGARNQLRRHGGRQSGRKFFKPARI